MGNLSDRAGAPTFNALTDSPSTKVGAAGKTPIVNEAENALVYAATSPVLTANRYVCLDFTGTKTTSDTAFESASTYDKVYDESTFTYAQVFAEEAKFIPGPFTLQIDVTGLGSVTNLSTQLGLTINGGMFAHMMVFFGDPALVSPSLETLTATLLTGQPLWTFIGVYGIQCKVTADLDELLDRTALITGGAVTFSNSVIEAPCVFIK